MNKKKKIFIMVTLSLFALGVLSFGTYALYNIDLLTDNNSISTGQVKMSYTESNEITLNNVVPTSDNKGISSTNYFEFKINTYIKTNKEMTMNYNIVLEPLNVDSSYTKFDNEDIKVYLTKVVDGEEVLVVGPASIDELCEPKYCVLKSQEETFNKGDTERSTTYRLRAWLNYYFDASSINENAYSYKFRIDVNNDVLPNLPKSAIQFAHANVGKGGLEQVTHTIDDTLQAKNYYKTEYRYRGGNVSNYVTFNNEMWRIIGIIVTEDDTGSESYRFKIIKDDSIGNMKWNETKDTTTNSYNNWVTSTLNTYLNNDYYNTLSADAKRLVGTTKYYLGGYKDSNITTDTMWQYERKNEANRVGYYYGTNPIMQNDENKKIALMYASDYGYAASKECTKVLGNYHEDANCITANNWLDKSTNTWLLTQESESSPGVFFINENVAYGERVYRSEFAIRPVLSLKTFAGIYGGNGTLQDPYTLDIVPN